MSDTVSAVKRTLTVIRPGDLKALKKPKFNEADHPRDRRGKFIEVGGIVSIFGGGQATVLGSVGGGRVEVEKSDGRRVTMDSGQMTMIRSASEARTNPLKPRSVGDAAAAPAAPATPEERGRPATAAPSTPSSTPVGAVPDPEANPADGRYHLKGADGSQAWLNETGDVGFLQRPEDEAPLRFDDVERWADEVDKLGMETDDGPDLPGDVGADLLERSRVEDEEIPDLAAERSTALRSSRTASPDQVAAFLHDGLGVETPAFREAGGDSSDPTSYLQQDAKVLDESTRQAAEAKREVAADITDRMRDIPDEVMLGQGDIDRLGRIEAGSHVLLRQPYKTFDGTVKQNFGDPANPSTREQLSEWKFVEVPRERFDQIDINAPEMPAGLEVVTADQWRNWKREERVDSAVQLWSLQSNGVNPQALAMQDTAAELFGLDNVAEWDAYDDFPDLRGQTKEAQEANRDFNEAFLLAQYEATQDRFREAGIQEVTVYRGHKVYTDTPEWAAGAAEGPAVVDDLALRPMSSFSTDPAVAGNFARGTSTDEAYIIEGTVPVDRILATPRSGFGSLSEAEMVVLAGPGEWNVRAADDTDGPRSNDAFDPFGDGDPADDLVDDPTEEFEPLNPVDAPAGLISSRAELMAAIAAADTDERRQALATRAAGLGLGELVPASWGPDGSVPEADAVTPGEEAQRLPELTDEEYALRVGKLQQAVDAALAAGMETHLQHTIDPAAKVYTPERAALHKEIVDEIMASAVNVPAEGKALFTGGLGGSGKTTGLNTMKVDKSKFVTINADDVKEIMARKGMIPEIPADIDIAPMEKVALVHEESSDISQLLADRVYAEKKNVIWDMTMNKPSSVTDRIDAMRAKGYTEFKAMFMDVPVELSVKRALKRHRDGAEDYRNSAGDGAQFGGRYVPPAIIRKGKSTEWPSANRGAMESVRDMFDDWVIYDNDVPKKSPPIRLYGKNDPDVAEKTEFYRRKYQQVYGAREELA